MSEQHQYLATAYRWGQENGHHYFVYSGPDKDKAIALAQVETTDRGGKYAVQVVEFDENGIDYQQIFYSPSSMEFSDAKGPYHNHKHDYFQALGHFMDSACEGFVYLPEGEQKDGIRTLKHTRVEVPQYMMNERDRQRELLATWDRIEKQRTPQPRKAEPCPTSESSPVPSATEPSP